MVLEPFKMKVTRSVETSGPKHTASQLGWAESSITPL